MIKVKVRAFSIMELVISLLLTGLLMGFGYYGYEMFNGQYQTKKTEIDQLEEINRLTKQLRLDVSRAVYVVQNGDEIELTTGSEKLMYVFDDDKIHRDAGYTDVYNIVSEDLLIENIATDYNETSLLVKSVAFNIKLDESWLPFYVYKEYPLDVTLEKYF